MLTMDSLRERQDEILALAARHGARNVRVLGWVARGEATDSSDLDLLVEWEPGRSLFDHARLKLDLEGMFGRRVDIGTKRSLNVHIRQQVLQEAALL
jgi:hypothetical protein